MLVVQDASLGIFMAILPILAGHADGMTYSFARSPSNGAVHTWFHGAFGGMYFNLS